MASCMAFQLAAKKARNAKNRESQQGLLAIKIRAHCVHFLSLCGPLRLCELCVKNANHQNAEGSETQRAAENLFSQYRDSLVVDSPKECL